MTVCQDGMDPSKKEGHGMAHGVSREHATPEWYTTLIPMINAKTQIAMVYALPGKHAHQDDSNDIPQPAIQLGVVN